VSRLLREAAISPVGLDLIVERDLIREFGEAAVAALGGVRKEEESSPFGLPNEVHSVRGVVMSEDDYAKLRRVVDLARRASQTYFEWDWDHVIMHELGKAVQELDG
jgi:hypothetical protein